MQSPERKCPVRGGLSLILTIIIFQCIGFAIGKLTQGGMSPWYLTIQKSPLTPPSVVFPVVWSILYCLLAVIGWFSWRNRQQAVYRKAFMLFGLQMVMNWLWSPIFFSAHAVGLALVWLILIAAITARLVAVLYPAKRLMALLLLPYLLWLLFASYLNAYIWLFN